jgi:hypothetical protein
MDEREKKELNKEHTSDALICVNCAGQVYYPTRRRADLRVIDRYNSLHRRQATLLGFLRAKLQMEILPEER